MLKVGKLYTSEEYFLMLYPDLEIAAAAPAPGADAAVAAAAVAAVAVAYLSNQLGKSISYVEKNIPLLVLNDKKEYIEVLAGDKKGWIIYHDWLEIREIDNDGKE